MNHINHEQVFQQIKHVYNDKYQHLNDNYLKVINNVNILEKKLSLKDIENQSLYQQLEQLTFKLKQVKQLVSSLEKKNAP